MKVGLDLTDPPSQVAAQRMQQLGFTVLGMYSGGPRAAAHQRWHQQDGVSYPVRDLVPYFPDGFVNFYVGRNQPWDVGKDFIEFGTADGDDANVNTGACGFDSTSPICLDLEAGTYQKYPRQVHIYCAAWVAQVNGAGHPAGLYSDEATIEALAPWGDRSLFDFTIMASWSVKAQGMLNPHASFFTQFDPMEPPPSDGWQCGGGTVAATSVDFDTFLDSMPTARYAL